MHEPIVLLDCDNVLADFVGGYLKVLGSQTGRWFTREQVTQWSIETSLGLTEAERDVVRQTINAGGFCEALEVLPGAIEGVRALHAIADVYIVTSPFDSCPTWEYERKAWLKRHFDIPHSHVVHTSAKHLVRGDVFVDDKTETVIRWNLAHSSGLAIRWATPHNRLEPLRRLSTTCDWAFVLESTRAAT